MNEHKHGVSFIFESKNGLVKPPLGVMPRELHSEKRGEALVVAITAAFYHPNGGLEKVPSEWAKELSEILKKRGQ